MNTKTKTKLGRNKYGRRKLFLCFRPVMVDINTNDVGSVRPVRGSAVRSGKPDITDVAMGEKPGVEFPRMVPAAAAASAVAASLSEDDDDGDNNIREENGIQTKKTTTTTKKKTVSRQRLLGLFKAVLFETSMAKKIRRRKLQRKTSQSNGSLTTKPGEPLDENSMLKELSEVEDGSILSDTYSSLRSSSLITSNSVCPSSLSSKSCSDTNKSFRLNRFERKSQKQDNVRIQQLGKGSNTGLYFLLISLLVLVIWGKVFAIFCTSTWLFFLHRWTIGNSSSENMVIDSLSLDSRGL